MVLLFLALSTPGTKTLNVYKKGYNAKPVKVDESRRDRVRNVFIHKYSLAYRYCRQTCNQSNPFSCFTLLERKTEKKK